MTNLWKGSKRWLRYHAISLFRVDDGSERVARGIALGAFVNFYPTFGLGVLLSGFLAGFTGGNVVAGVVGGALFALAWPLLFFLNMKVGELIYTSPIRVEDLEDVDERTIDLLVFGKTFLAGAGINSILSTLVVYSFFYYLHDRYRAQILSWFNRLRIRRLARQRKSRQTPEHQN